MPIVAVDPSVQAKLHALRARVADLEGGALEHERKRRELEARFRLLTSVTNEGVAVIHDFRLVDVSPEFEALFGYTRAEALALSPLDVVAPESIDLAREHIRGGYEHPYVIVGQRKDGSTFMLHVRGKAFVYHGHTTRVTAFKDITERARAEEARKVAAVKEQLIEVQASMLAQLSTPLLPIADRVVVLPLIGDVNQTRATQVIETLTRGVFTHRAAVAILDITGIRSVNAEVVDMLVRATRSIQLLGARVILTGIRPEIARMLVELGIDLGHIVTHGTLQQGVTDAFRQTAT